MDLDLATQVNIEKIKAELAPLQQQLAARNQASVKTALQAAANDFKAHFENAGFTVIGSYPSRMTAKFHTLEFALGFDEAPRLGCWALLQVQQMNPKKPEVKVALVRKGSNGPQFSMSVGRPDPVADAQKQLVDAQAALAGPGLQFDFQIDDPAKSTRTGRAFKNFATLGDLLRELYK
ncbi:alpha-D-ribose 1-methylphosphonate 5-triphosphate synthase subunit PhnH [Paraburkholderia sp. JPY465]|uniref:hypothetical protein n=1 Tax=Paraburkholderia sp. JPY465 TaxID=3042285 RepID=UPI003D238C1B